MITPIRRIARSIVNPTDTEKDFFRRKIDLDIRLLKIYAATFRHKAKTIIAGPNIDFVERDALKFEATKIEVIKIQWTLASTRLQNIWREFHNISPKNPQSPIDLFTARQSSEVGISQDEFRYMQMAVAGCTALAAYKILY